MRRRLLLGAGAALLGGAAGASPHAAAQDRLRQRLAGLRLGANLERWFPIARDKHPRRLGPQWWRGFRAAGFDHVRMFIPDVRETGDSRDILRMFQQAVEDAAGAGLPVLLGLSDFYYHSHPWPQRHWDALTQRAGFLGPRLDPDHVVLAPLNEPAFPDNERWVPVRDRLLAELRKAAPRHLLCWGGHEWCSTRSLLTITPPEDPGTIAEVHDYQGGDAAAVRRRFGPVAAWRDRHGMTVMASEVGGTEANRQNPAGMAEDIGRVLPVLRELRLPTALWAYTHGGWYRLQRGDDSAPRPELRAVLSG